MAKAPLQTKDGPHPWLRVEAEAKSFTDEERIAAAIWHGIFPKAATDEQTKQYLAREKEKEKRTPEQLEAENEGLREAVERIAGYSDGAHEGESAPTIYRINEIARQALKG